MRPLKQHCQQHWLKQNVRLFLQYDAMLYKQMEATRDAYQQYSKSVSARGVKRMNFIDFNEAVG
ncbi:hypothetical protein ACSLO2_27835, partial [Escherichia coli]|uniref:hypothetical protein n=1 Tax=Escherichia coli TaxID=562 RepID=UPI003EE312A5